MRLQGGSRLEPEPQAAFGKPDPILQDADLDERETHSRDSVHFFAYTLTRWMVLGLLVLFCGVNAWNPAIGIRVGTSCFYLVRLTLWSGLRKPARFWALPRRPSLVPAHWQLWDMAPLMQLILPLPRQRVQT